MLVVNSHRTADVAGNKKYKALLFDYDGTLVDTNSLVESSWRHMAEKGFGKEIPREIYKETFGKPLWDAVHLVAEEMGFGHLDTDWLCGLYRSYQAEHKEHGFWLFPGIEELLSELRKRKIIIGIVTSRTRSSTLEGLEKLGIKEFFDCLVTADDTDIHKPSPEPALMCCRNLDVAPADALMVGDSVFDLQCGNNAGCGSCFVKWSFCTGLDKALREGNPTYVADTPADILELF